MNSNRHYRVRTDIGENVKKIDVDITQTYDVLDILSLKIDQVNKYPNTDSNFGIIVGRVLANGGLGIPNAKVSVFIPNNTDNPLYQYINTLDTDRLGVKYNLLDKEHQNTCHNSVGSIDSKEYILENSDILEVFDEFYKYTTRTNNSGDYMIYGVPTGQQTVHLDVDLSDIGILSQRPIDFMANGYSIESFESPSKFKTSTNLSELVHIHQQDRSIQIYPYISDKGNPTITRCDFELTYKFQTNCIFMGSLGTDKGGNSIGKNCKCNNNIGRVSELTTSEGFIEMIRKTPEGKIEEFNIKGQRLIDGDGIWCYQIPMNLDYITTDEFGNTVPTDNPNKGIATRTDVRFRFSLGEGTDTVRNTSRARYLIPHNPFSYVNTEDKSNDYEFGSKTRDESFRSLFMNNVYSVKSYIPYTRQKPDVFGKVFEGEVTTHNHTGIKYTSLAGDNNNIPYNSLNISLGFMYRFICSIIAIIVSIITAINAVLSALAIPFCGLCNTFKGLSKLPIIGRVFKELGKPFCTMSKIFSCIPLGSSLCSDGVNEYEYYPGCLSISCAWGNVKREKKGQRGESGKRLKVSNDREGFDACVALRLSETNEVLSYNFSNDWINGFLYFPLWFREVKRKRSFFGVFGRKQIQDNFCNADRTRVDVSKYSFANLFTQKSYRLKKVKGCALDRNKNMSLKNNGGCTSHCVGYEETMDLKNGLIKEKTTKDDLKVFYYSPSEWNNGDFVTLFATDIINLGPISGCSQLGVKPFIDTMESSTYKMPYAILFTDIDEDETDQSKQIIEHAGASWLSPHTYGLCKNERYDGGLFYDLSCIRGYSNNKSCINLQRICELDVNIDESKIVPNIEVLNSNPTNAFSYLISDGFISNDEIYNNERRSAFSTLNNNNLKIRYNEHNGSYEYDLSYMYMDNFDGVMYDIMRERQINCSGISYRRNYNLEYRSDDYIRFIYGETPKSYRNNDRFYETQNSFYFFFGLKEGKTALNKYNNYFSQKCSSDVVLDNLIDVFHKGNSWCLDDKENERDGFVAFNTKLLSKPFSFYIQSNESELKYTIKESYENKFFIGKTASQDLLRDKYVKSSIPSLPNGSYTYRFEDIDGIVSKGTINLSDNILTYTHKVSDFRIPKDELDEKNDNFSAIANNNEGLDTSTNKIRNYGGVLILSNIKQNNEPLDNVKITLTINNDIINDKLKNYNGLVITPNGTDGDGLLFVDNNGSDKTYYIGLPYPNIDYKVTITELCDGIESGNTVSQNFTVKEFEPLLLFINDIDSRLFSKFRDKGDYYGWDRLKDIGTQTTLVSESPTLLNPTYNEDGVEPIYSYSDWYAELKPVYDYLSKQQDDNTPYSWIKGYYIEPNKDFIRVMSSETEFVNNGGVERELIAKEINSIIKNRLKLKEKVTDTFYLYHLDTPSTVSVSSSGGTEPYETATIFSDSEYDSESKRINQKGRNRTKDSMYYQTIPTLTKVGGNIVPYKDSNGATSYYTSISNMDADLTSTPRGTSQNDFKRGVETNFLKLHFFDKQSNITFNSWGTMRHIPYYKPTDQSKKGKFFDYGGLLSFTMDNFKVSKHRPDGTAVFPTLEINGYDVTVKTLNSEDDFPTKRVVINNEEVPYPNFNIGYGNEINVLELQGFGEVLTVEDETGYKTTVETKSNETFGIKRGTKIEYKVERSNSNTKFYAKDIKFSSNVSYGTIYAFSLKKEEYIPSKIEHIRDYNEYKYMKFLENGNIYGNGLSRNTTHFSDRNGLVESYEFKYAQPGEQYFFILENEGNKFISPIYDFTPVNGKVNWDTTNRTVFITFKSEIPYYIENYETKLILEHNNNITESEQLIIENGKLSFSPPNFDELYGSRQNITVYIEDIVGLRHFVNN